MLSSNRGSLLGSGSGPNVGKMALVKACSGSQSGMARELGELVRSSSEMEPRPGLPPGLGPPSMSP